MSVFTSDMGIEQIKNRAECLLSSLNFSSQPIEVWVAPEGTHWTQLPIASEILKNLSADEVKYASATRAITVRSWQDKTYVFFSQGDDIAFRHELTHVLSLFHLSPTQEETVRKCYTAALRDGGPFARVYGLSFDEYLTTWSELFEGSEGPKGIRYLADMAPEIYRVLTELTGRDPLAEINS